jgi:hypothetical protein
MPYTGMTLLHINFNECLGLTWTSKLLIGWNLLAENKYFKSLADFNVKKNATQLHMNTMIGNMIPAEFPFNIFKYELRKTLYNLAAYSQLSK